MQATDARAQASTEELTVGLSRLVRHLLTATGQDFFQEVERLELSLSQIKTMSALVDREAPTVRDLSEAVGLSLPGISRAIEGLVKRGLVKRADDPEDRRCKRVTFTARGRRTFEGLMELRLAGIRRFVVGLEPEERDALAAGLGPLLARGDIADLPSRG